MSKIKWPIAEAAALAEDLTSLIRPHCEHNITCGSIRREKPMVGDVELIFVPKMQIGLTDFFAPASVMETLLAELLREGILRKRLSVDGKPAWGPSNKLSVHVRTGIPVDWFATTMAALPNYTVCRTGGMLNNIAIATRANELGWEWNPTDVGYTKIAGEQAGLVVPMTSEEEVFKFVKLPYLHPRDRK